MQRASGAAVRAVIALGLTIGLASPLLAQRADRATISGVVTDNQAAAVPGATVTIKNEDTGVETVLVTNSAGAYTSPPLVLGRYSVTVDLSGFKKTVSSGILLQGGGAIRHDVALQVGDLTETVEVKSVAGISETRPDVSHTVDEKYYQDLPFVTGSDVRLAESVLLMQPGYLPMRPNGDPMFRGSQFNSRINGGQAMATENFFDGAAFGYASGHQQSHESTPPLESVQEVKVISTTYSAQYGHTSGGFIEYSSKSGTNAFRGSVYEYMADDAFNQNTIFAERGGIEKTPIRNDNFGFTLGGPVRLPGYNGRNKTHFFVNLDYTRIRSGTIAGFGNTTPIDAFKAGDFGALLTGNQIGTDALGRPIFQGQIFDPQTTRMAGEHSRARSVPEQRHSRRPPAPQRRRLADRAVDGRTRPRRARQQRRRRRRGRPDVGAQRAQHHVPRGSELHAGLQDEHQLLLEPPSLGTQLRGRGWVQLRVRSREGVGPEHRLLRQRVLPAHLHAPRAPAVRLDHQQQPAGPLDDRVGSLVHGRQSPVGGCELAAAAVARDRQSDRRYRRAGRRTADDAIQRRQRPLHADRARGMAELRLREERSLAVLERRHVGEGTSHDQGRDSSSAITTSRPAAGQEGPRRATSTSTASAPPGTTQLETA